MQFKSIVELLTYFKDEKTCVEYYEQIRWSGEPHCPHCGCGNPYKTNRGWKCRDKECHKKFTVKVGTIFENSKIPFKIWFAAIYLATTSKKGVSSVQLATQLNITQKTAWFVLHRIREMLKEKNPKMLGETKMVEADEAYIGGKEKNKHVAKRRSNENPSLTNEGKPYKPKKVVIGLIERDGKVLLKHIPRADVANMKDFVRSHVPTDSTVYTDESRVYGDFNRLYSHKSVKHSIGVYVDGDVHTNTIENFWSILKRGIYGIYHQVSDKHFSRYLDEFSARFNTRELTPQQRFDGFLEDAESVLNYEKLTS